MSTAPASTRWPDPARTATVVALKRPEIAKTRLATVPDPLRRRLAWTMALDTVAALAAAVPQVLVVSDQPGLADRFRSGGMALEVLVEASNGGMNAALQAGAAALAAAGFGSVLACVGDLPALTPASVRAVLAASAEYPRAYLADESGVGTTMLVAHGVELDPHFEGLSAAAHAASGAVDLAAGPLAGLIPDARHDVDTEADLVRAVRLGLGPATAALMDPVPGRLRTGRRPAE